MTSLLVSVDVGGTLCHFKGPSLAAILAAKSPLPSDEAYRIMQHKLHNQREINSKMVASLCEALLIQVSDFPRDVSAASVSLLPGAAPALRTMSRYAKVVTLSNCSCLDSGTEQMCELLNPWVVNYFQSWRIGYSKPDPMAFRYVADALETSTINMVHIGDDWDCDVIGARSAGVKAVWISKGRSVPEPDYLLDKGVLVARDLVEASGQMKTFLTTR